MLNRTNLDDIAQRLASLLPPGASELSEDVRKNVKALITGSLAKLDLVTREEFDVQAAVLARTRARLEELEKQLSALESRIDGNT